MESKAKLLGHSIHQMLVPLPIGLLFMGTMCDLVVVSGRSLGLAEVAFYDVLAGICAALVAALFGLIDLTGVPRGSRALRVGIIHGVANVVAVALFVVSIVLRWNVPGHLPSGAAFAVEVIGFFNLAVAGWLGGELVDRLGVGVDDNANVNAPSSIATRRRMPVTDAQLGRR